MKYLKDKNSRRRGVAIELAIGLLLIMTAMSTIIVATTMIQINKQSQSINDLNTLVDEIEKIEYDQIGIYFEQLVNIEKDEINSNTVLPTTVDEIKNYNTEKKSELEESLNEYFKQFIIKKLSFEVEVETKVADNGSTTPTPTTNENKIITTTKQNFTYTFTYKLLVKKELVDVFATQHQLTFDREVTTVEEKTTKEQDVFDVVYYTYTGEANNGVYSDTIDLTIKNDYFLTFEYHENVEAISVSAVNTDDVNKYIHFTNEGKHIIFKLDESEESKTVIVLLKYKLKSDDTIKEITINVTIDKSYDGSKTESNNNESYHFSYSKKIKTEIVVDESITPVINKSNVDSEINKVTTQWEYK